MKYHYGKSELHGVWDEAVYQYRKTIKVPFTPDTFADFGDIAKDLKQYDFSKSEVETDDFIHFVTESRYIAHQVYEGVEEGKDKEVPQSYIDKWAPIA